MVSGFNAREARQGALEPVASHTSCYVAVPRPHVEAVDLVEPLFDCSPERRVGRQGDGGFAVGAVASMAAACTFSASLLAPLRLVKPSFATACSPGFSGRQPFALR